MLLTSKNKAGWPSGKRRWFEAPVTSLVWVRDPFLSFCWHPIIIFVSVIVKICTPLFMLLTTKYTGSKAEWYVALVYGHQSLQWRGFESHSCHFVDIPIQSLASFFWTPAPGISYHHPCYWPQKIQARWPSGKRHHSLRWCAFKTHSCLFVDIAMQSIVSFILNTCKWYLLLSSMLLTIKHTGRMGQWSKSVA